MDVIFLISLMSFPMAVFKVGSPEPEKVMQSIFSPEEIFFRIWEMISDEEKYAFLLTDFLGVRPS